MAAPQPFVVNPSERVSEGVDDEIKLRTMLRRESVFAVQHQFEVVKLETEQRRTMDLILTATLISATVAAGFGVLRAPKGLRRMR